MDEDSSLTNPGYRKSSSSITLILWWALNIGIVVFVFLAFLMSTLSYAHGKDFANQVNNSFITQQGGLIEKTYNVAPAWTVKKGSVASFCGHDNTQLCEGLGPNWNRPFYATSSWSPAVSVSVAQLSLYASVYFHVVDADHNTLRATYIESSAAAPPTTKGTASITQAGPVTSIHARPTGTANVAVVMYTTHNQTFLQAVTVTNDGNVTFNPNAITLFNDYNPIENGTLHRDIAIAESWILITHAYDTEAPLYQVYVVDPGQLSGLRPITPQSISFGLFIWEAIATEYLGQGFIVQATSNAIALAQIDFVAATIKPLKYAELFVILRFLQIHALANNSLLLVGTQTDYVDDPLSMTLFVEWYTAQPYLRTHVPTNLLGNQFHRLQNYYVSLCYLPPSDLEPYGGIFFTYLDGFSNRAKIARARPVWSNDDLHLLPSPSLDISSHRYNRFNSTYTAAPHLTCPIGTGANHVLVTLQDFRSSFNTFTWAGGYRYAGVAQNQEAAGKEVDVIRAGISSAHDRLIPGFSYYVWNNGTLAPFTSYHELWSPNGFALEIGTAISTHQLHLEPEAFDRVF
jgi:hypothetical protein